jgi:hypothetical protein
MNISSSRYEDSLWTSGRARGKRTEREEGGEEEISGLG